MNKCVVQAAEQTTHKKSAPKQHIYEKNKCLVYCLHSTILLRLSWIATVVLNILLLKQFRIKTITINLIGGGSRLSEYHSV